MSPAAELVSPHSNRREVPVPLPRPIASTTRFIALCSAIALSPLQWSPSHAALSPSAALHTGNSQQADAYRDIPADQIPTGILSDRVASWIDFGAFSGNEASAVANRTTWRHLYAGIYHASAGAATWPAPEMLPRNPEPSFTDDLIHLSVLDFDYARVRPDAVATGALVRAGNHIRLGAGSAFEQRRVVAMAPLRDKTYYGKHMAFTLAEADCYGNTGRKVARGELDFGDGRGRVSLTRDGTCAVSYTRTGNKSISGFLVFNDGSTVNVATTFVVAAEETPAPSETHHLQADVGYDDGTGMSYAEGDYYVYLADGHDAITNPIIVIEGFDPDNKNNWPFLYEKLNQQHLIDTLHTDHHDVVVLNFDDGADYIQRNAYLAVKLIQVVEAPLPQSQTTALVGASMGGLVGRYALAYMEKHDISHRVRTYITIDTPHRGANVALGVQYLLKDFCHRLFIWDLGTCAGRDLLDTPAARQMLIYSYADPPSDVPGPHVDRATFLSDLAAQGGMPTHPRLVAFADGDAAGTPQDGDYGPGDALLHVDGYFCHWTASATGPGTDLDIFNLTGAFTRNVPVTGAVAYDGAPGGSSNVMQDVLDEVLTKPGMSGVADEHAQCFIPTVSALDRLPGKARSVNFSPPVV